MTNEKHTPGSVTVKHDDYSGHYDLQIGDEVVAQVFYVDNVPGGRGEADADRLAACFNACEGIPDPSVVPELVALARQYHSDLLHPPAPDSRERRIAAIDAMLAKAGAGR
jgi:hypothetical protein